LFFRRKSEGRENKPHKLGAKSILVPLHGIFTLYHSINNNELANLIINILDCPNIFDTNTKCAYYTQV